MRRYMAALNPEIRFCCESLMPFRYDFILHMNDVIVTVHCLRAV
jgi:hypothetical protein